MKYWLWTDAEEDYGIFEFIENDDYLPDSSKTHALIVTKVIFSSKDIIGEDFQDIATDEEIVDSDDEKDRKRIIKFLFDMRWL